MFTKEISLRTALFVIIGIVLVQITTLWLFGQPPICTCGHISLWTGQVLGPENSQQLSDWYTLSHIIHGFVFYVVLWLLFPRMPFFWRLLFAVGIEMSWEIFENTPWLINHYRQQALAQGYTGDSIINSISDTCAMIVGFLIARRIPVWATLALLVAMEIFTGIMIHDGLFLNILNFLHPIDFVTQWQAGLGK